MTPIELTETYLILGDEPGVEPVEGGGRFWERLATDRSLLAELDDSRLVSAFRTSTDWSNWECHPAGDEVIIATSGRFVVHTEHKDSEATSTIGLKAGQTIVMPADTWHTVDVAEPGEILTITPGKGTEHRDR